MRILIPGTTALHKEIDGKNAIDRLRQKTKKCFNNIKESQTRENTKTKYGDTGINVMPVITLNVNGLNTLIKDRSSEQIF